jgi:serine/threonine protein kinase
MSEVWSADDVELERRVALKLLAPDADRARFEREARAAAALAHPNITQLYDYGDADGRPYMVLEYLPGGTLEDRLANGRRLDDAETQTVAAGMAAGLAHAHDRGLVHRDLKPANILFDAEERPKIADFGIARLDGGGTLTEAGTVLGTAAYISPEQAAGEPATAASDVYSFGVILFRMLTGRLPFEAVQPLDLVALHRDSPPPRVADVRADVPVALAALADASLAKDPAARPRDGRALAIALGAPVTLDGAAVTQVLRPAPAAAPVVPAPPRRGRGPLFAATLVLLALGGGAAAYALTQQNDNGSSDTTVPTLATVPTRSLPKLTTAPTTTAPAAPATTATTQETTTRAATTRPATTAAPPPTTTVAPPPTTAPPATTTEPPPATTTAPTTTDAGTTLTVP